VKFAAASSFHAELERQVAEYFAQRRSSPRDSPRMYLKSACFLAVAATSYILLLRATEVWTAVPLAVVLGLATAGIGFNVQHDGGHKAYSNHSFVNRLAAATIDLVGGSSYVWNYKHNIIHHSYANIAESDDDIDA